MNIGARNAMKNSNALCLEVTIPYLALAAKMNVLSGLCLLAVLKVAVVIHHLLPQLDVTPVRAKTVALVTENESSRK